MRRITQALLIALVLFHPAAAAQDKHLLWEVEAGGGHAYLLGSIHVADEDLYPLDEAIETAFAQSRALVLEIDLAEMNSMETQAALAVQALNDKGDLRSELTRARYLTLQRKLKRWSIDLDRFLPFKPWFAALSIAQEGLSQIGFSPEYGLDRHFYTQARGRGMRIEGLETAEYQIGLLAGLARREQVLLLVYTVDELENFQKQISGMMEAWKRGDDAWLEETLLAPMRSNPAYSGVYDALFAKRNASMTHSIEELMRKRPDRYFVVVGAGHLLGEDGIVERLERKGYRVSRR